MQNNTSYSIWQSFGAIATMCSFLKPVEVTHLQAVNKWAYSRAIARVQMRIYNSNRYSFLTVGDGSNKWRHKMLVYDHVTKTYWEYYTGNLALEKSEHVQVNQCLYRVRHRFMAIARCTNLLNRKKVSFAELH